MGERRQTGNRRPIQLRSRATFQRWFRACAPGGPSLRKRESSTLVQDRRPRAWRWTRRRGCCSTPTTVETRSTWHALTTVAITEFSSPTPSIREPFRSTPRAGRRHHSRLTSGRCQHRYVGTNSGSIYGTRVHGPCSLVLNTHYPCLGPCPRW